MTTIDHQPAQPVADDWDWQLSAACRGMDVETFYHPAGERWHQKNERITQAKQICQALPRDQPMRHLGPENPRALRSLGRTVRNRTRRTSSACRA